MTNQGKSTDAQSLLSRMEYTVNEASTAQLMMEQIAPL
jgi:hypothetical protein